VLYRPEAFDPLTDEPWDEERVRAGIRAIVADADEAYDPDKLWPAHEWDSWQSATPMKNLYVGAGGVVWALDALRRRGLAEPQTDLAATALRALELWRAEPDLMAGVELPSPAASSLFCGEAGLLLVALKLAPSQDLADLLLARIRENVDNEAEELMWGSPGTILAARAIHGSEVARESADALLGRRGDEGLWTQRLYGGTYRLLGPVHGLVGNVRALLPEHDVRTETAAILAREAVVEDGLANWPEEAAGSLEPKLQWCHGAPGIVATAADYLDEQLLLAGAEVTWRAGAPGAEKGFGLCHGTAGNGFALLKTFARTGDERWLDRARRFAVHALRQVEDLPGRYSLFTGGVGAALFAADCLDAEARFPILDTWD
jgi:Lanthionine synthetase C-like protein